MLAVAEAEHARAAALEGERDGARQGRRPRAADRLPTPSGSARRPPFRKTTSSLFRPPAMAKHTLASLRAAAGLGSRRGGGGGGGGGGIFGALTALRAKQQAYISSALGTSTVDYTPQADGDADGGSRKLVGRRSRPRCFVGFSALTPQALRRGGARRRASATRRRRPHQRRQVLRRPAVRQWTAPRSHPNPPASASGASGTRPTFDDVRKRRRTKGERGRWSRRRAQVEPVLASFSTTSGRRACRRLFAWARSACQDIQIRGLEAPGPAMPAKTRPPRPHSERRRRGEGGGARRNAGAEASCEAICDGGSRSSSRCSRRRRSRARGSGACADGLLFRRDVPASRAAPADLRAHAVADDALRAAAPAASTTARCRSRRSAASRRPSCSSG